MVAFQISVDGVAAGGAQSVPGRVVEGMLVGELHDGLNDFKGVTVVLYFAGWVFTGKYAAFDGVKYTVAGVVTAADVAGSPVWDSLLNHVCEFRFSAHMVMPCWAMIFSACRIEIFPVFTAW
jgi:hypothetical protein